MIVIVHLKAAHEASGLSKYRVSKDTGIAMNTVAKYVDEESVQLSYIPAAVLELISFYGEDWRDPKIIEVLEDVAC